MHIKKKKIFRKNLQLEKDWLDSVLLKKKELFLTNVPSNYIKISSGLGKQNLLNLIILAGIV